MSPCCSMATTRRSTRALRPHHFTRSTPPGATDRVRLTLAAEVLGLCQRALEMTLEYVKDRKQFGVPVGSFQAVAHRCAQMLLATESARSTAYFAAWAAEA